MIACIPSMNVPAQTKVNISWASLAITLTTILAMGLMMLFNVGTKGYVYLSRTLSKRKNKIDKLDIPDVSEPTESVSGDGSRTEPTIVSEDASQRSFGLEGTASEQPSPAASPRRKKKKRQQPEMSQVPRTTTDILDGYTGPGEYEDIPVILPVWSAAPINRAPSPAFTSSDMAAAQPVERVAENIIDNYSPSRRSRSPLAMGGTEYVARYAPSSDHEPAPSEHGIVGMMEDDGDANLSQFGSPFLSPSERITGQKYEPSEAGVSRLEAIGAYDYPASKMNDSDMPELSISSPVIGTDFLNQYEPSVTSQGGGPSGSEILGMYGSSSSDAAVKTIPRAKPSRAANIGRGALMARQSSNMVVAAGPSYQIPPPPVVRQDQG